MKILGRGLTRRGLLRRLAVAAAALPAVKLSSAVARAERHREHHAGARPEDFWIGHC